MEGIAQKERDLKEALQREDREILAELGKYLEALVALVESREVDPNTLEREIEAEREIHKKASEVFENAKKKEHTEEEIEELFEMANSLLSMHKDGN